LTNPIDRKYYGGLNNAFYYKGFELSLLFQYSSQLSSRYLPALAGRIGNNQPNEVLGRWFAPGDKVSTQRFSSTSTIANLQYDRLKQSTADSEDASFIRLKTLSIGYQFTSGLLKKIKLQQAKLFIHGHNLMTFTNYSGLDPETGSGLPPLRMVTAGIQIRL